MDKAELIRQMIAEKEKQIELYQAMVAEWKRELGQPSLEASASGTASGVKQPASDWLTKVTEWQFFNKSQVEAAKLLLEMVGFPLRTASIVDGIEKGSVKVGGKSDKDKKQNLYTILHRADDFVLFAKDTWGLSTWPGAPKKEKDNGDDSDKKADKEVK